MTSPNPTPRGHGPAEAVLSCADGVKRTGPGRWMVKSPLNPTQKTGSVSVRELDDGRVLVHDFAGSATADILAAWGLEMGDLFPEPLERPEGGHRPVRRPWLGREVLKALEAEVWWVLVALDDLAAGKATPAELRDRARIAARRLRGALEVCDAE